MELAGRKIRMFRAHYDPIIGPTPRNAFDLNDPNSPIDVAEMAKDFDGIYVKCKPTKDSKDGAYAEHFIPLANIQSIKLMPIALEETKRGPGRPKAE
jgi:hypothetical protein